MRTSEERLYSIKQKAAERAAAQARRSAKIKLLSVIAAALCIVIAANLILFVPFSSGIPDLTRFSASEYYPLMNKINELTYTPPRYKNNFEKLIHSIQSDGNMDTGISPEPLPPTTDRPDVSVSDDENTTSPSGENNYQDVTDNQVQGVTEGDLFKRTQTHLFYLAYNSENYTLSSYTIAGEDSALCSSLTISAEADTYFKGTPEMYISVEDTATIFANVWSYENDILYTTVISVDISDPLQMSVEGRVYISGSYVTSRYADGDFLLISNFRVRNNPDFDDESAFLPQYGTLDNLKSLPMDDIVFPEDANSARYTVICRIGGDMQVKGHTALLSYSQQAYVSEENIFVTRNLTEEYSEEDALYPIRIWRTEIACISYLGEGLEFKGAAITDGTVLNQYSMDEKDGLLRVVTTKDKIQKYTTDVSGKNYLYTEYSAALYIISLEDFTVRASLEDFAPIGEEVTSVRFEGDIAWVCTANVAALTDPVFRIDLTDTDNITYTDTGTIDGFSTSLVDFKDGTLLGIGYGNNIDLKIELYERDGESVTPICSYTEGCIFSRQYKAYYIGREEGLVGLHVNGDDNRYLLLHFDGYSISPILEVPLGSNEHRYDDTRATVIDGCLYVFTANGYFDAVNLPGTDNV